VVANRRGGKRSSMPTALVARTNTRETVKMTKRVYNQTRWQPGWKAREDLLLRAKGEVWRRVRDQVRMSLEARVRWEVRERTQGRLYMQFWVIHNWWMER